MYYDLVGEGMNGLELPWFGTVFVNPPYSAPKPWIEKAYSEVQRGMANTVVLLLPADISTAWWRHHLAPHTHQYIWPGRIKFHGPDGKPVGSPKSGSIVALMARYTLDTAPAFTIWEPRHVL